MCFISFDAVFTGRCVRFCSVLRRVGVSRTFVMFSTVDILRAFSNADGPVENTRALRNRDKRAVSFHLTSTVCTYVF